MDDLQRDDDEFEEMSNNRYINSRNGNDANDGMTFSTAWKSVAPLYVKRFKWLPDLFRFLPGFYLKKMIHTNVYFAPGEYKIPLPDVQVISFPPAAPPVITGDTYTTARGKIEDNSE